MKQKIRDLIDHIFFVENTKLLLENRLLISSLVAGIFISFIAFSVSIIISSSLVVLATAFTLFTSLLITYYFVRYKGKFEEFVIPIIIVAIIGISIIWVFDGGINGSDLFPGFVILTLAMIIVSNEKKKYVLMFFIASVITIYLIQLYRPDIIVAFPSEKARWIDSIVTVTYSSLLIFWIISFLHKNYTLERLRAEQNASKLRDIIAIRDKLFSVIAHDLRGPFNNIIGLSEMMMEENEQNETKDPDNIAGLINTSAIQTLVMVDNLLNWAKSQSHQLTFVPKRTSLRSLIKEVTNTSKSIALLKNISIHTNQSEEIDVYVDENIALVILRNLISNAIKFSDADGRIDIDVSSRKNMAEITISDSGIGMDEEKIKTLFDASTNATSPGTANEKGTGLGLILCKEFVEKVGGTIWVDSEIGKGSSFTFTLPMYS